MSRDQTPPLISVVIEGYNQSRSLGLAINTLAALRAQSVDLTQVEVIMVGSAAQREAWEAAGSDNPFHSVHFVEASSDLHYLELKNLGAEKARGALIAMTDSDAFPRPEWLAGALHAMEEGAEVSVGISYFNRARSFGPDRLFRLPPASITWGWILGRRVNGVVSPVGLIDHNVVYKAEVLRRVRYHTDFGRVMGGPRMFSQLKDLGFKVVVAREQRDVHSFGWFWWFRVVFRYGFEVYMLRRVDPRYPNPWIAKTGPFEPIVTLGWHMLLDLPRWFRFCRIAAVSPLRTVLIFPLHLAISFAGRATEMLGMYSTMIWPKRMRRWAERF